VTKDGVPAGVGQIEGIGEEVGAGISIIYAVGEGIISAVGEGVSSAISTPLNAANRSNNSVPFNLSTSKA